MLNSKFTLFRSQGKESEMENWLSLCKVIPSSKEARTIKQGMTSTFMQEMRGYLIDKTVGWVFKAE